MSSLVLKSEEKSERYNHNNDSHLDYMSLSQCSHNMQFKKILLMDEGAHKGTRAQGPRVQRRSPLQIPSWPA